MAYKAAQKALNNRVQDEQTRVESQGQLAKKKLSGLLKRGMKKIQKSSECLRISVRFSYPPLIDL